MRGEWGPALVGSCALLVCVFFSLECLRPKTKIGAPSSLIFFEDIAGLSQGEYAGKALTLGGGEQAYREINAQVWAVSQVARLKHRQVAAAIWGFGVSLVCALLAGFAVIFG